MKVLSDLSGMVLSGLVEVNTSPVGVTLQGIRLRARAEAVGVGHLERLIDRFSASLNGCVILALLESRCSVQVRSCVSRVGTALCRA